MRGPGTKTGNVFVDGVPPERPEWGDWCGLRDSAAQEWSPHCLKPVAFILNRVRALPDVGELVFGAQFENSAASIYITCSREEAHADEAKGEFACARAACSSLGSAGGRYTLLACGAGKLSGTAGRPACWRALHVRHARCALCLPHSKLQW